MNKTAVFSFVAATLAASSVSADIEIVTDEVRSYQLPGIFEIGGSQLQRGADNTTVLTNTMGSNAEESACGVVIASDSGATLYEYRYNGPPTICLSTRPHPGGGVFIRGLDPTAEAGSVSGFTSYLDGAGN